MRASNNPAQKANAAVRASGDNPQASDARAREPNTPREEFQKSLIRHLRTALRHESLRPIDTCLTPRT